jgi:hypothetical protein
MWSGISRVRECLENFIVRPEGGIERRVGSQDHGAAATQDVTKHVRLVDFVFSRNEAISIEISVGKFRFIANGAFIGAPYEVTGIYGGGSIPYADDEIFELQFTQSADVIFITHPDHPIATLSRYDTTDWRYEIPTFDYGPYLDQEPDDQNFSLTLNDIVDRAAINSTADDFASASPGDLVEYPFGNTWVLGRIVTVNSSKEVIVEPLEDRSLVLSKEVYSPGLYTGWDSTNAVPLYNTSISGTNVFVAFSNTSAVTKENIGNYLRFVDSFGTYYWMLVDSVGDIVRMGAYGIIAIGDILNPILPTGIITRSERSITAKMIASDATFFDLSVDVPRSWRLVLGGKAVHAVSMTDAGNNGYTLKVQLNRSLPRSNEGLAVVQDGTTNDWNAGAWFPGNYPSTVFFHEERLGFAGTYYEPQTGWLSKTADYYNFATTDEDLRVLDDSAITFTVNSDAVNQVLWGISKKRLVLGTAGGEFAVGSGNTSETALTPNNSAVNSHSSYGSEFIKPIMVGKSVLFLQKSGRKLRKMEFNFSDDLESVDLTIFAGHILKSHGGGRQMTYQPLPESMLYVLLGDGQIAALTYEADQQIFAWTRFVLGGPSAVVESICAIPEGSTYRLYLVVRRTINGSTVRRIESILPEFRPTSTTDFSSLYFMDGYVSGGAHAAALTGLTQFAGCTVNALVDNKVYHDLTVGVSGNLTLPAAAATRYAVGFAYTSKLETLPLEAQAMSGTGQGKVKRIDHLSLRLINSIGFSHGTSLTNLKEESFVDAGVTYDSAPPMFTGDRRVSMPNGFNTAGSYFILQTKAYPLTILSLMPEAVAYQ